MLHAAHTLSCRVASEAFIEHVIDTNVNRFTLATCIVTHNRTLCKCVLQSRSVSHNPLSRCFDECGIHSPWRHSGSLCYQTTVFKSNWVCRRALPPQVNHVLALAITQPSPQPPNCDCRRVPPPPLTHHSPTHSPNPPLHDLPFHPQPHSLG